MQKSEMDSRLPGFVSDRARRQVDPSAVEARFITAAGRTVRMPWLQAAGEERLEECGPVVSFPARKGRRTAPGWLWMATGGRMVHYGFGAMRVQAMMLDFDPRVVAVACSPVELLWRGRGGNVVSHAPHLMARLADDSGLLVDCAGRRGAGLRLVRRALHVEAAAVAAGWHYRLSGPPPPVVEANVRWLSGYRHPRFAGGLLGMVAECFQAPTALIDGVRALGEPLVVWPAVFHALWRRVLHVPLESALHERTVAVATEKAAGR
ncbi:TnsA-like heteromeric transposase endonuclease subunit [Streptomyces sp. NPDC014861]|uniref:TnsA-like heteromeric transposase endonuclease subunit n=1 Tax=Streptomyces sp. NPDC014861 TaxID=3364923 RepID=UPI0037015467